jgi:crotonobetainyl-CoA:carnitine CoA-transferase CaiB-like acyl-CoA transferase
MAVEVAHPLSGTVKVARNPIRLSETPLNRYTAPPTMGQHTREVLVELLGLEEGEIARLAEARVI